MTEPPKFLFYGDVNIGKTATIATLCELCDKEINKEPGSTKKLNKYDIEIQKDKNIVVAQIIDSPGIQNTDDFIHYLKEHSESARHTDSFLDGYYPGEKDYVHDRKLIKAIGEADILLLVVLVKQDLLPEHRDIIETARLWGKPVGALLNWTEGSEKYRDEIEEILKGEGILFIPFDANTGGFSQRKDLFEFLYTLKKYSGAKIEELNPFNRLLEELVEDWTTRRKRIAQVIVRNLDIAIKHRVRVSEKTEKAEDSAKDYFSKELKIRINLVCLELKERYKHKKLEVNIPEITPISLSLCSKLGGAGPWWKLFLKKYWEYGPISRKKAPLPYEFAKKFIDCATACFRIYASHSHGNLDEPIKEITIPTNSSIKWKPEDEKVLKSFCKSARKINRESPEKSLVEILEEKLLESLKGTDEHPS